MTVTHTKRHVTVTYTKRISQVYHRMVSLGCIGRVRGQPLHPSSLASLSPCMHMCTDWMHLCMLGISRDALCVTAHALCFKSEGSQRKHARERGTERKRETEQDLAAADES